MTEKEKTKYMRDYMRWYRSTKNGLKKHRKAFLKYQKSKKGKETRKKLNHTKKHREYMREYMREYTREHIRKKRSLLKSEIMIIQNHYYEKAIYKSGEIRYFYYFTQDKKISAKTRISEKVWQKLHE